MLQFGSRLFWILATAFVVLVLATLRQLPPTVASHFDAAGMPNGWSSRSAYAILLIGVGTLLPLMMIGIVNAVTRNGPHLLNIPSRSYWSRPEHGPEAVRRVRAYMWWLACIMTAVGLVIHWLILAAHTHHPPRLSTPGFLFLLIASLLAIGLWAVGWYRLLRPPRA